jgi:hypothetical protein
MKYIVEKEGVCDRIVEYGFNVRLSFGTMTNKKKMETKG